jgi:hypothetical protein
MMEVGDEGVFDPLSLKRSLSIASSEGEGPGQKIQAMGEVALGLQAGVIEQTLPQCYVDNIPKREVRLLSLFLDFVEARPLPIDGLFINGGYVRDLLLGKVPDDLDISICLQKCAVGVTVTLILEELESFIEKVGAETYGFESYKSVVMKSDTTKCKQLDTAKAVFHFGKDEPSVEVDVMPTIGEEIYEEDGGNRVPTRNERGSPQEDALRRDLTIGAMLLKVSRQAPSVGDDKVLEWTLVDFYDGLSDLKNGVLRAPRPAAELVNADAILRTKHDRELAQVVGLDCESPGDMWWVKILRDDPLRILRAFRFAAKLNFVVHETFWKALPFALDSLKSKVAGSRKLTEILKLAKYGKSNLIDFFGLCFRKQFVYLADGSKTTLASGIFGGVDYQNKAHFLPSLEGFDKDCFLGIVEGDSIVMDKMSSDQVVSCFLAVALLSSRFPPYESWRYTDDPAHNAATDAATSMATKCMMRACNGLGCSNVFSEAGLFLLSSCHKLGQLYTFNNAFSNLDAIFEARVPALSSPGDFGRYFHVWDVLRLGSGPSLQFTHAIVLSMIEHTVSPDTGVLSFLQGALTTLKEAATPKLTGRGISTIPSIPPHLRGHILNRLLVFCRLRMDGAIDLDAEGALTSFLQNSCKDCLNALHEEMFEDFDGKILKEVYKLKKKLGKNKNNTAKTVKNTKNKPAKKKKPAKKLEQGPDVTQQSSSEKK